MNWDGKIVVWFLERDRKLTDEKLTLKYAKGFCKYQRDTPFEVRVLVDELRVSGDGSVRPVK